VVKSLNHVCVITFGSMPLHFCFHLVTSVLNSSPRIPMSLLTLREGYMRRSFFLSLLTTQMHLAIRGQHLLINARIKGNNKKRQYNVTNMKLSACKFNEKNVFRQFQKKLFLRCQLYAWAYVKESSPRPFLCDKNTFTKIIIHIKI